MPNWNSNIVVIYAPIEAVKAYLVPHKDETYLFNMHLLYADHVPASDPTWEATWDYTWCLETTGSKWLPEIHITGWENEGITCLEYESARTPNNGTLRRLHELTGRMIQNQYDEPGCELEGTFTCCKDYVIGESPQYRPRCQVCAEKRQASAYGRGEAALICNDCRRKAKIIS